MTRRANATQHSPPSQPPQALARHASPSPNHRATQEPPPVVQHQCVSPAVPGHPHPNTRMEMQTTTSPAEPRITAHAMTRTGILQERA